MWLQTRLIFVAVARFSGGLTTHISLVMRQSSGWACSANDKKKKKNLNATSYLACNSMRTEFSKSKWW